MVENAMVEKAMVQLPYGPTGLTPLIPINNKNILIIQLDGGGTIFEVLMHHWVAPYIYT
jgi:hypothetical protein